MYGKTISRPRTMLNGFASLNHRLDDAVVPPLKEALPHLKFLLPWLLAAMVLPSAAGPVLFLGLTAFAVQGSLLRCLQALTVQFLLLSLNPVVFKSPASGGLHHILPFVVLFRLLTSPDVKFADQPLRLANFIVCITVLLVSHGMLFSHLPAVSIMKAVLFGTYAATSVLLLSSLPRRYGPQARQWLMITFATLVLFSAPLLFVNAGTTRNATGFNGILSHPNVLGACFAVALSYVVTHVITARRLRFRDSLIIGLALVEMYRSESRGGLLSFVLAVAVWGGFVLLGNDRRSARAGGRLLLLAVVALPILLLFSQRAQSSAAAFISKFGRSEQTSLVRAFQDSRGGAIRFHLQMLNREPYFGHGFQVVDARSGSLTDIEYDPLTGKIPISASVENGFIYSSLLAELGYLGVWLGYAIPIVLLVICLKHRQHPATVVIYAVLLTNVTEATLFSPSGIGAWNWQFLSLGLAQLLITDNSPFHPRVPS